MTSCWPLEATTGPVRFTGPTAQPLAPAWCQAEHLRAGLTRTGPVWDELPAKTPVDSSQRYRGQLRGAHAGVVLPFIGRLTRPAAGWQQQLAFQVGTPTGEGLG